MNIEFVIVGIRERASLLCEEIGAHGQRCKVIGFKGDSSNDEYKNLSTKWKLINKRILSPGEFGCAMGHWKAYLEASPESDWLVVFEDDVELNFDKAKFVDILGQVGRKPTVVTFSNVDMGDKGQRNFKRTAIPFRTHAYAINRSALSLAKRKQKEILSTADWPVQWSTRVKFIYIRIDGVELLDIPSTIESDRLPLQRIAEKNLHDYKSQLVHMSKFPIIGHKLVEARYFFSRVNIYWSCIFNRSPFKYFDSCILAIREFSTIQ